MCNIVDIFCNEYDMCVYSRFPFVEGNLLFYTVLFQEFIVRLFRMDLTTLFNACMLFRAAKVYSLPNLSNMIQRGRVIFTMVLNFLFEPFENFRVNTGWTTVNK